MPGFSNITWKNGKPMKIAIKSNLGGVLRLRSYWQLKGKELRPASGNSPNPLMASAHIKEPIKSSELIGFKHIELRPVYEYDVNTKAGKTYTFDLF